MMFPFQKIEEHSYDTELTECVELGGGKSASCRGNQRQRCKTVADGKSGDRDGKSGFTQLASWRERLEEACWLRPDTHLLLGAEKVKNLFSSPVSLTRWLRMCMRNLFQC